ncbi:hypothetical protein F5878DRAFT_613092 [Lentinula raphanica]|uniref:Uncharacterized protein n=1 Tax=Lentinula raphanica TaxID=153919 RepID=A0AA38PD24_9AGAR|nr:hypothetical protein F5878DRAFT_613092 [Lentinula raphanica]
MTTPIEPGGHTQTQFPFSPSSSILSQSPPAPDQSSITPSSLLSVQDDSSVSKSNAPASGSKELVNNMRIVGVRRICSVRNCYHELDPADTAKMCINCRMKHRRYSKTKRTKRKMEKAALMEKFLSEDGQRAPLEGSRINDDNAGNAGTSNTTADQETSTSTLQFSAGIPQMPPTPTDWNPSNLDPRLFIPEPLPRSSSSALAGALGPMPSDMPQSTHTAPATTNHEVLPGNDHGVGPSEIDPLPSEEDQDMMDATNASSSLRRCTGKGCTSRLAPNYKFRTCTKCRARSKQQNTSSRRKWRTEGMASDQGIKILRELEDERRKQEGLMPLDGSPDDLRAWEQSVINQQAQLPPSFIAMMMGAVNDQLNGSDSVASPVPPASSSTDPGPSHVPEARSNSDQSNDALDEEPVTADAAVTPSTSRPPHICTVYHCHTVLPGTYRYKRCEKHRLQTLTHTKLRLERKEEERLGLTPGKTDSAHTAGKESGNTAVADSHVHEPDKVAENGAGGDGNGENSDKETGQNVTAAPKGYTPTYSESDALSEMERLARQIASKFMAGKIAAEKRREKNRVRKRKQSEKKVLIVEKMVSQNRSGVSEDNGLETLTSPSVSEDHHARSDGTSVVSPESLPNETTSANSENCSHVEGESGSVESPINNVDTSNDDIGAILQLQVKKLKSFTCLGQGCMNLLNPVQRWRTCGLCRHSQANVRRDRVKHNSDRNSEAPSASQSQIPNVTVARANSAKPAASHPFVPYAPYQSYAPHAYTYQSLSAMSSLVVAPTSVVNPYAYPYAYQPPNMSVASSTLVSSPPTLFPAPAPAPPVSVSPSPATASTGSAKAKAKQSQSQTEQSEKSSTEIAKETVSQTVKAAVPEPPSSSGSQTNSPHQTDVNTEKTPPRSSSANLVEKSSHNMDTAPHALPTALPAGLPPNKTKFIMVNVPPTDTPVRLPTNTTKFIMVDGHALASKYSLSPPAAYAVEGPPQTDSGNRAAHAYQSGSSPPSLNFVNGTPQIYASPQPLPSAAMTNRKITSVGNGSTLSVFSVANPAIPIQAPSTYGIFKLNPPPPSSTSAPQVPVSSGQKVSGDPHSSAKPDTPVEDTRKRKYSEVETNDSLAPSDDKEEAPVVHKGDESVQATQKKRVRAKEKPKEPTQPNTVVMNPGYTYPYSYMYPPRYCTSPGCVASSSDPLQVLPPHVHAPSEGSPTASTSSLIVPTPPSTQTPAPHSSHPYVNVPGFPNPPPPSSSSSYSPYPYPYGGLYSYPPYPGYPGYGSPGLPGYPVYPPQNAVYYTANAPSAPGSKHAEVSEKTATTKGKEKTKKQKKTVAETDSEVVGVVAEQAASRSDDAPATTTDAQEAPEVAKEASSQPTSGHPSSTVSERLCHTKTCRRPIPQNITGTFCTRCRARFKKHQLKTKQRFKLEPRKVVVGVPRTSTQVVGEDEIVSEA